jgi:hypothetical protein
MQKEMSSDQQEKLLSFEGRFWTRLGWIGLALMAIVIGISWLDSAAGGTIGNWMGDLYDAEPRVRTKSNIVLVIVISLALGLVGLWLLYRFLGYMIAHTNHRGMPLRLEGNGRALALGLLVFWLVRVQVSLALIGLELSLSDDITLIVALGLAAISTIATILIDTYLVHRLLAYVAASVRKEGSPVRLEYRGTFAKVLRIMTIFHGVRALPIWIGLLSLARADDDLRWLSTTVLIENTLPVLYTDAMLILLYTFVSLLSSKGLYFILAILWVVLLLHFVRRSLGSLASLLQVQGKALQLASVPAMTSWILLQQGGFFCMYLALGVSDASGNLLLMGQRIPSEMAWGAFFVFVLYFSLSWAFRHLIANVGYSDIKEIC